MKFDDNEREKCIKLLKKIFSNIIKKPNNNKYKILILINLKKE